MPHQCAWLLPLSRLTGWPRPCPDLKPWTCVDLTSPLGLLAKQGPVCLHWLLSEESNEGFVHFHQAHF